MILTKCIIGGRFRGIFQSTSAFVINNECTITGANNETSSFKTSSYVKQCNLDIKINKIDQENFKYIDFESFDGEYEKFFRDNKSVQVGHEKI